MTTKTKPLNADMIMDIFAFAKAVKGLAESMLSPLIRNAKS